MKRRDPVIQNLNPEIFELFLSLSFIYFGETGVGVKPII